MASAPKSGPLVGRTLSMQKIGGDKDGVPIIGDVPDFNPNAETEGTAVGNVYILGADQMPQVACLTCVRRGNVVGTESINHGALRKHLKELWDKKGIQGKFAIKAHGSNKFTGNLSVGSECFQCDGGDVNFLNSDEVKTHLCLKYMRSNGLSIPPVMFMDRVYSVVLTPKNLLDQLPGVGNQKFTSASEYIANCTVSASVTFLGREFETHYERSFEPETYCTHKMAMSLLEQMAMYDLDAYIAYRKLSKKEIFRQGYSVEMEEGISYEFKGSKYENQEMTPETVYNAVTAASDTICAFLNTMGGRLYIGVHNDRRVVHGIRVTPQQADELLRRVNGHYRDTLYPFISNTVRFTMIPVIPVIPERKVNKNDIQEGGGDDHEDETINPKDGEKLASAGPKCVQDDKPSTKLEKSQARQLENLKKKVATLEQKEKEQEAQRMAANCAKLYVLEIAVAKSSVTHWYREKAYARSEHRVGGSTRALDLEELKRRIIIEAGYSATDHASNLQNVSSPKQKEQAEEDKPSVQEQMLSILRDCDSDILSDKSQDFLLGCIHRARGVESRSGPHWTVAGVLPDGRNIEFTNTQDGLHIKRRWRGG